jgi:hypothetical protein
VDVAAKLLKAGLQFSYQDLMQAVLSHTYTVERWVQAVDHQTVALMKEQHARLPRWLQLIYSEDSHDYIELVSTVQAA